MPNVSMSNSSTTGSSALPIKKNDIQLPSAAQINQWRQSFSALNSARLKQARSLLFERQTRVLDVLPLLIHLNHPQLPGFINNKVPAGI